MVPGWVRIVSYVFTLGTSLCILSISVLAVFFQSLVVDEQQLILSPLFAMVGAVAVFGILLMEFAHSRALAGYREDRRKLAQYAQGGIGVLIALFLALVHPLLALPSLIAAAISFGGLSLLTKYMRKTPQWDFNAQESIPILSGRDFFGFGLATTYPRLPELAWTLHLASVVTAGLSGMAVSSWLAGQEVLAGNAVGSVALMSLWAAHCLGMRALLKAEAQPEITEQSHSVVPVEQADDEEEESAGLRIRNLSVAIPGGRNLLTNVSLDLPPGSITGVIGETGAGKSLLLQALSDPFGLRGLDVKGRVHVNGSNIWERKSYELAPQSAFLPNQPLILPASGEDNLTCFHKELSGDRGKRYLEKLVFSSQTASDICAVHDASCLPDTQKRCLAFARAFLLSPPIYLMDRPEDGLPEKQIAALLGLIRQEIRLGRSVIMATENRALLEACDKVVVLQEGRVIDFGDAREMRTRRSSGWMRFVGERQLETEDNLDTWIRSHFKRDGDEANRRKMCVVASEMLAFSCQNARAAETEKLSFEFKHFEGYCVLKLQDKDSAVTNAQLDKARKAAEAAETTARLTPLAAVIRESLEVETTVEMDRRVLTAKIETYDPRKTGSFTGVGHAVKKS
ncbi:hypothetical protein GCM10011517_19200 [Actibacterium pelagium]|uniref:ABC transporter domain-containing protein n=2 Tax=Actibacterium pelagium TaxID=2029103 RepID=A0A917AGV9_9RHOB|nr:hypothetical protein GCM10011517_19200 [Actibacterium pelagium]